MARPQDRNLFPGFKSKFGPIDVQVRGAVTVAQRIDSATKEMLESIKGTNLTFQRKLAVAGRQRLEEGKLRISGGRGGGDPKKRRITSAGLTFGGRGAGTFHGMNLSDPASGLYGFGWPDLDYASQKTRHVWKSIEYGLSGTELRVEPPLGLLSQFDMKFPFEPPGAKHILPKAFTFRPKGSHERPYGEGKMIIIRKGRRGGLFGTRDNKPTREKAKREKVYFRETRFRKNSDRMGKGLPAKHFLEKAWADVLPQMVPQYEQLPRQAFREFQ